MLAMADKHGHVEASLPGLADLARVSLPDCLAAIAELLAPDEWSRSQESDGRRIETMSGGWHLINHGKYREKMGADERREYLKLKQREYRRKQKSTDVNKVSDTDTVLTHAAPAPKATTKDPGSSKNKPHTDNKPKREKEPASLSPAAPAQRLQNPNRDPFTDAGITERAGRFVEHYGELYPAHRHGARYAVKPARDYAAAVTLCTTWPDDARLEKLAICFLTTDHKFAEEGSRTIPQFLALASWCDSRLAEWEVKNNGGKR